MSFLFTLFLLLSVFLFPSPSQGQMFAGPLSIAGPITTSTNSGFLVINHTSAAGTSAPTVDTSANPINCNQANAAFVAVGGYAFNETPGIGGVLVTDNLGNTYHQVTTVTTGDIVNAVVFYSKGITTGNLYWTATTGAGGFMSIAAMCVKGALASGGYDQLADARPTPATTAQAGSVTPSNTNQIILAAIGVGTDGGANISSINGGFTIIENVVPTGNNYGITLGYLIQTITTPANPLWGLSAIPTFSTQAVNLTFASH